MKICFLQDYRGVLTSEQFFATGSVADLPQGEALCLAGRAEPVVEPVSEPEKPKQSKPKKVKR